MTPEEMRGKLQEIIDKETAFIDGDDYKESWIRGRYCAIFLQIATKMAYNVENIGDTPRIAVELLTEMMPEMAPYIEKTIAEMEYMLNIGTTEKLLNQLMDVKRAEENRVDNTNSVADLEFKKLDSKKDET